MDARLLPRVQLEDSGQTFGRALIGAVAHRSRLVSFWPLNAGQLSRRGTRVTANRIG